MLVLFLALRKKNRKGYTWTDEEMNVAFVIRFLKNSVENENIAQLQILSVE